MTEYTLLESYDIFTAPKNKFFKNSIPSNGDMESSPIKGDDWHHMGSNPIRGKDFHRMNAQPIKRDENHMGSNPIKEDDWHRMGSNIKEKDVHRSIQKNLLPMGTENFQQSVGPTSVKIDQQNYMNTRNK